MIMQNMVLLEIFRGVLLENLPKYEKLVASGSIEDIKALTTVIQAIRSSAKVVALELLVELCASMELFLTRSLELNEPISELNRNFFLTAGELMKELTHVDPAEIPKKTDSSDLLIADLTTYFTKPRLQTSQPEPQQSVVSKTKSTVDPVLIGLFKSEMAIHSKVMADVLEKGTSATNDDLSGMMRAAHSIKGAFRITGFNPGAGLASRMEDYFNTLISGEATISEELITRYKEVVSFFHSLVDTPDDEVQAKASDITRISKLSSLLDISKTTTSQPKAPKPEPAKPPKEKVETKIDLSMVDLFKIELESNTKVLERGLVDAEGETSKEKLEPLMRAAHSIKGAARIVGINQAVGLAHSMEDVLSLAIKSEIRLSDKHIDLLLQGNDIFKFISRLSASEIESEIAQNIDKINSISASLSGVVSGEEAPKPKNNDEKTVQAPQKAVTPHKEKKEDALFVRVLADNLNRLLGLAGEIKIQAKFTKPFQNNLLASKQTLREASRLHESLTSRIEEMGLTEKLADRLDGSQEALERLEWNLNTIIDRFEIFSRNIERLSESLGNQVIASKMRPVSDGLHGIPRMVRDLARDSGKKINFEIFGDDTMIDRDILDKIEAPLSHLIANAVDHGIETPEERLAAGKPETGRIVLEAGHRAGFLTITVEDDGRGIDETVIKSKIIEKGYVTAEMSANLSKAEILDFLFLPGFSTKVGVSKVSGRGVGLDIVMNLIHQVGGKSKIDSEPGKGSKFTLQLPVTLSILRALLLKVNSELYALPLARVETLLSIREDEMYTIEDRQYYKWAGENLGIVNCSRLMGLTDEGSKGEFINLAVVGDRTGKYAVAVDAFLGERDIVVSVIDGKLGKIPNISAAAILEEGSIALIIDPDDLIHSIETHIKGARPDKVTSHLVKAGKTKNILVVDDSLTVREVERKLLENSGYSVVTAVDGIDGFNTLQKEDFDLVITDVDMPRMNGIQFVEKIKSDPNYKDIPVMIVSYKDREEDRLLGLNAGANYYLTKSSFHDESLINAVIDLIGEAT